MPRCLHEFGLQYENPPIERRRPPCEIHLSVPGLQLFCIHVNHMRGVTQPRAELSVVWLHCVPQGLLHIASGPICSDHPLRMQLAAAERVSTEADFEESFTSFSAAPHHSSVDMRGHL